MTPTMETEWDILAVNTILGGMGTGPVMLMPILWILLTIGVGGGTGNLALGRTDLLADSLTPAELGKMVTAEETTGVTITEVT